MWQVGIATADSSAALRNDKQKATARTRTACKNKNSLQEQEQLARTRTATEEQLQKADSFPFDYAQGTERQKGRERSCCGDAEEFGHLVVEEALAGFVGLDPFAVEDELGDGSLAGIGDDEVGCARGGFDIDLFVGDVVGGEEALGFAAVAAPGG